ncbi:MAG TPA: hypothetical protein VGB05_02715 [Pyrinomonadaceae bacterium]|jgi:cobalamin biosynthesis protein CobT
MRLSKIVAVILLCATTLTFAPAARAARPSQKTRAKAQTPAPQTEITKEKIEAIISSLEEAAKKKEVAVFAAHLAPDMKYKSQTGNNPVLNLSRTQYLEAMKRGFELALDYVYLRKSLTITITPDGQSATAHTETYEMLTMEQGTLAGHAVGLTTFKIYKGKILIDSVESINTPV